MIIDEVTIDIEGGSGGNGAISFRREKYIPRGGPDGGNGGKGGGVYFSAVSDLTALKSIHHKPIIKADLGANGLSRKKTGKNGKDVYIEVPVGTTVMDILTKEKWEFVEVGQQFLICSGGKGGRGNFEFKSNKTKAPHFAEKGQQGEKRKVNISLQFIADAGFIGLPSAGKSSLLNLLTKAEVKVGNYPFTTTHPNLGELDGIILADIPGLIEGAHEGKGLGIKFLKHISKTKILLHCIDSSSQNIKKDYMIVHSELEQYSKSLAEKEEVILLTKADLADNEKLQKEKIFFKSLKKDFFIISIFDLRGIPELKKYLLEKIHK